MLGPSDDRSQLREAREATDAVWRKMRVLRDAWRSWVQIHWLGFVQNWGYPNILWYIMIYYDIFGDFEYIYILYISMGYIIMINHVILGYTTFSYILRPMHGQPWQTCHCLIGEPCQPLRSHEHSTRFLVSALPLQADSFRAFLNYLQGAEGKVLGQTDEDRLNIRVDPGDFCLRHSTTMRVLMSSRFAAPQSTRSTVGNLGSWWFGP